MSSPQSVWEDHYGSSHVDFELDTIPPLQPGRFLGPGVNGGVHETSFNGVTLAWKKIYCRRAIRLDDRREIESLKRLRHKHIINIVGSYTHGKWLGLLFWPIAVCDLWAFLEDLEELRNVVVLGKEPSEMSMDAKDRVTAIASNELESKNDLEDLYVAGLFRLQHCYGCIANALSYVHQQHIKHKDLKPRNVLVSNNRLWITDFGASTDFSDIGVSVSEDGDQGTPKYRAPEVSERNPNRRSADIFSLGAMFLEMTYVLAEVPLENLNTLRPAHDRSFQANVMHINSWFSPLEQGSRAYERRLNFEIRQMLDPDPDKRPTATDICSSLYFISNLNRNNEPGLYSFYGACCEQPERASSEQQAEIERLRFQTIVLKNRLHAQNEWFANLSKGTFPSPGSWLPNTSWPGWSHPSEGFTPSILLPLEKLEEKERLKRKMMALAHLTTAQMPQDEKDLEYLETPFCKVKVVTKLNDEGEAQVEHEPSQLAVWSWFLVGKTAVMKVRSSGANKPPGCSMKE